jgi:UDP-4-amino-4,6-dideoxy-N-acetyl-beta-L-altrosamine N-acetyltransferase
MELVSFELVTFEDIELIRNWRNSKEVSKYMYTDGLISKEQQVIWFSNITNSNKSKYWIINYNKLQIGVVNLTNIDFSEGSSSWAFYIGEMEFRESNAAAQTEFYLIEKAFYEFNLNILNCEVIATNIQVINLHKRFGFKVQLGDNLIVIKNGEAIQVIKMKLLKEEWETIRLRLKKIIFNN